MKDFPKVPVSAQLQESGNGHLSRRRKAGSGLLLAALLSVTCCWAQGPETGPEVGLQAYAQLLKQAVKMNDAGTASEVDYAWLADHSGELKQVLTAFSAVRGRDFESWSADARLAFLINAYNAFTLDLILTEYPNLNSIKELGSVFRSPWKKRFFMLLQKRRSLDEVEHQMIRGGFDEPRIHAAVNCASCGCPALLDQPFQEQQLDQQLNAAMSGFLSDRGRNHFDLQTGSLWLSPIFDWYSEDFESAAGGLDEYLKPWVKQLGWPADATPKKIRFTEYDWQLNDLGRCHG